MIRLWTDTILCFLFPKLTRWTVVVVNRATGEEYPMDRVRFRWHGNAQVWAFLAHEAWVERGHPTDFAVRAR